MKAYTVCLLLLRWIQVLLVIAPGGTGDSAPEAPGPPSEDQLTASHSHMLEALLLDDPCAAGAEYCALHALQKHGQRQVTKNSTGASLPTASGAEAVADAGPSGRASFPDLQAVVLPLHSLSHSVAQFCRHLIAARPRLFSLASTQQLYEHARSAGGAPASAVLAVVVLLFLCAFAAPCILRPRPRQGIAAVAGRSVEDLHESEGRPSPLLPPLIRSQGPEDRSRRVQRKRSKTLCC